MQGMRTRATRKHSMSNENVRVILFHKQKTSAKTLFLLMNGTVCAFDGFPELAQYMEPEEEGQNTTLTVHPASIMRETEKRLEMPEGSLEAEGEFCEYVDTAEGTITVLLARFSHIDPPKEEVAKFDGKFIAITEARRQSDVELLLLRRAYEVIMEG